MIKTIQKLVNLFCERPSSTFASFEINNHRGGSGQKTKGFTDRYSNLADFISETYILCHVISPKNSLHQADTGVKLVNELVAKSPNFSYTFADMSHRP